MFLCSTVTNLHAWMFQIRFLDLLQLRCAENLTETLGWRFIYLPLHTAYRQKYWDKAQGKC